jgi:hypothetical protein
MFRILHDPNRHDLRDRGHLIKIILNIHYIFAYFSTDLRYIPDRISIFASFLFRETQNRSKQKSCFAKFRLFRKAKAPPTVPCRGLGS